MKKILVIGTALAFSTNALATDFFTIGTAGVTSSSFPMGVTICRAVNTQTKATGLHCNVESTDHMDAIINNLKSGKTEFGIVQSDAVSRAYHGTEQYKGKAYPELRAVMAIYPTVLTLVVNKTAGIKTLQDIKGKRINLGHPGSSADVTVTELLGEMGLTKQDFAFAGDLEEASCPGALKNNKLDGYFAMVGHPSANIGMAADSVQVELIPIVGNFVEKILKDHPYYFKTVVPGGLYKGVQSEIPTLGVKAVLVTSATASDKSVRLLMKTVLDNFENFKKIHPLLAQEAVTKKNLLVELNAPLHPAAAKYYKEVGLLK